MSKDLLLGGQRRTIAENQRQASGVRERAQVSLVCRNIHCAVFLKTFSGMS
jgi:hypothetical protein